jgi:hypothetical protein
VVVVRNMAGTRPTLTASMRITRWFGKSCVSAKIRSHKYASLGVSVTLDHRNTQNQSNFIQKKHTADGLEDNTGHTPQQTTPHGNADAGGDADEAIRTQTRRSHHQRIIGHRFDARGWQRGVALHVLAGYARPMRHRQLRYGYGTTIL